jgi:hypothetical protein
MPRLYMLTVPGLDVASDWAAVHDHLLDDFPAVTDVLATTMSGTLLIVYDGNADIDGWLAGVSEGVLSRRATAARAYRVSTSTRCIQSIQSPEGAKGTT